MIEHSSGLLADGGDVVVACDLTFSGLYIS